MRRASTSVIRSLPRSTHSILSLNKNNIMKKTHVQKTHASLRRHGDRGVHGGSERSRSRANSIVYGQHNDDRFDVNGGRLIYRYELYDVFDWLRDFSH